MHRQTPTSALQRKIDKANFKRVCRDLSFGFISLFVLGKCIGAVLGNTSGIYYGSAILISSVLIGCVFGYLQLFLHEAAHWNIHPSRRTNDLLANTLLAPMIFTSVRKYRSIHVNHHKLFGTDEDPENTYQSSLDFCTFAKLVTGFRALELVITRSQENKSGRSLLSKLVAFGSLLSGIIYHFIFTFIVLGLRGFEVLPWFAGLFIVFPMIAGLRQILEHRSTNVQRGGSLGVTRNFKYNPLLFFMCSAGFNYHGLHHQYPAVSYTRLDELIKMHKLSNEDMQMTTYGSVFIELLGVS